MMKIFFLLFLVAITVHSQTQGNVVRLPDGSVVLADAFFNWNASESQGGPKQVSLNPRLLLQTEIYAKLAAKVLRPLGRTFSDSGASSAIEGIKKESHAWRVVFYVVKDVSEMGRHCSPGVGKIYQVSSGQRIEDIACTVEGQIYLVESAFRQLDLKAQVLVLFHEALSRNSTKEGGVNFEAIGKFLDGLSLVIDIVFDEQNGNLRRLTQEEINQIFLMHSAAMYLNLNEPVKDSLRDCCKVHPYGGALLSESRLIHPDAYISPTSYLSGFVQVEAGAKIFDSSIDVLNYRNEVIIGKSTTLISSIVYGSGSTRIGANSFIAHSTFVATYLDVGENALIKMTDMDTVQFQAGKNLKLERVDIHFGKKGGPHLVLKNDQVLRQSRIVKENFNFAPADVGVQPISVEIPYLKTKCADVSTKKLKKDVVTYQYCSKKFTHREMLDLKKNFQHQDEVNGLSLSINHRWEFVKDKIDPESKEQLYFGVLKELQGTFQFLAIDSTPRPGGSLVYENEFKTAGPTLQRKLEIKYPFEWEYVRKAVYEGLDRQGIEYKVEYNKVTVTLKVRKTTL